MERLLKISFLSILLLGFVPVFAQENPEKAGRLAKKYMQEAEEALKENDLATAEALYREAIAKDPSNAEARYNLGNLYYNNEITGEAVERHTQSAKVAEEKTLKHSSFHNQGNAYMKQKKYKEAVEAYKNSLRNNPNDEETRYNLALAKKLLEEEKKGGGDENKDQKKQQQNQQDQKKEDQKEDNKEKEGDQGDKEKNDEGKPEDKDKGSEKDNQDKKEGQDKRDDEGKPQNKDKQKDQGDKSNEQQQNQPQPQPGQLSPQQVKNLLEAMGNEEKKVQEKINAKKVKGSRTKTEKDW